jgi:hypothetical protein
MACLCGDAAAAELPGPGCYERSYDVAHLAKHPGQFVVRVTAVVKLVDAAASVARMSEATSGYYNPHIASLMRATYFTPIITIGCNQNIVTKISVPQVKVPMRN